MNWPAYPEYKNSGVEYLDQLPAQWTLSKFSRHIAINSGQVDPRDEPFRNLPLIAPNHIESETGQLFALESAEEQGADSGKYVVREGQLIYSKIRPNLAKAVIAPVDCLCSADMYGLTPDPRKLLSEFTLRVLLSKPFTEYVVDSSMRVAMPKVNHDSLGAAPIWYPPLSEQRAIVDFLDREIAKIDSLIGKQEHLVATLREDRAAKIDSAFPMAAELTRLKAVLLFAQTGPFGTQLSAEEYIAEGVPVINPTHIQGNKIVPDVGITVSAGKADDLARHQFRIGDIVLGRKGEVDKSALVDAKTAGFICGSDAMLLRPRLDVVVPAYLWWFLQSPSAHSQLEQWSVGSTVAGLNQTTMRKIYLPHPRLEVQHHIVDRLEVQTAKVDALVAKASHVIETLCEYRSAIITDAVTGKIDVREAI